MNNLVDTHCHIHAAAKDSKSADLTSKKWHDAGEFSADKLLQSAQAHGVNKLICVGTDLQDSIEAVDFAEKHNCFSSIGVHPHEASRYMAKHDDLEPFVFLVNKPKMVAVGEVGLDYYYQHSPKDLQIILLEKFLELAQKNNLPVIFHVREAFEDFWPILDNFKSIRGVLHSFTSDEVNLDKALQKGLYIGLNGIMTFTRDQNQLNVAKKIPVDKLLLETDSPYLTPVPIRGKICKPEHVKYTYEFLAKLRDAEFTEFAQQIDKNTSKLFNI